MYHLIIVQHLTAYKSLIHALPHFHLTTSLQEHLDYCVHFMQEEIAPQMACRPPCDSTANGDGETEAQIQTLQPALQPSYYRTRMPKVKKSH